MRTFEHSDQLRVGINPTPTFPRFLVQNVGAGFTPARKEKGHPLLDGLLILPYALLVLSLSKDALLFLQCHLNVTAGTLFGTKTAPFAEIQVEFVQSGFFRYLNRIVRAIHKAIAAVIAESTAKASFGFIDDCFKIQGRIELLEMLQPHVDRQGFLLEPSGLLIIIRI